MARAVRTVGEMISRRTWSADVRLKPHTTFKFTSTSDIDEGAEQELIDLLQHAWRDTCFITEESTRTAYDMPLNEPHAFFIDPRDGTTEDSHELPYWCVSVGAMEYGELIAGAIFAPEIRGGLHVVSEKNVGIYVAEHDGLLEPVADVVRVAAGAKPEIHFGLDVQRRNAYNRFHNSLPSELKPRGMSPSGALGLAHVAIGRIDALVQAPQFPWDWAAGMAMVLENKSLSIYPYRIEGGEIVPVKLYDPRNFSVDEQTLGFVVGKPEFSATLFERLVKDFGE